MGWATDAPALRPNLNYGLRNCRRYINTHNTKGESHFIHSPELLYTEAVGAGSLARSYAVATVPAQVENEEDIRDYLSEDKEKKTSHLNTPLTIEGGANLVVVNFAPGGVSMMHKTVSIDFSICVEGNIQVEMDSGEKKSLGPGDHVIQRATMHRWSNLSQDKPARLIAVLLDAEKFNVNGKPIEEKHVEGSGAVKSDGTRY